MSAAEDKPVERFPWFAAGAMLAVYVLVLSIRIDKPWIGAHDWNGAAWSTAARHLLERPISETHLGVSLDHGTGPLDPQKFYVHHPPLVVWLMAGAYKAFGISEIVGRIVPAIASVFGACCLAALAFRLGGRLAALLALAFYLAMPLQTYYGKMPNHEPLGHAFMLAACLAADCYRRRPSLLPLLACSAAVFLAGWSCWIAYVFALALGLSAFWDDERNRPLFYAVGFSAAAALATVLLHIRWVREDGLIDLLAAFFIRSAETPIWRWCLTVGWSLMKLLTPMGVTFVALAPMLLFREMRAVARPLFPLFVAGCANVLLFRQGAFVHEYYIFYIGGFAALLAGIACGQETSLPSSVTARRRYLICLVFMGVVPGFPELWSLHGQQSNLYASDKSESERFVVKLGQAIAERIPADARILCDAAPIGEHLGFYADRRIVHYGEQTEKSLPEALANADGVVFNIGLPSNRTAYERVSNLVHGRVIRTAAFRVEEHDFIAVTLSRAK